MAIERTLSIIKPDATRRNLTGKINAKFEEAGLRIVAQKRIQLTPAQAGEFYAVHKERPFFGELTEFMASGPLVAAVVEGERVIEGFRSLAGTTDPTTAAPGTVRGDLGRDWGVPVTQNLVHGSDSPESAEREIKMWFPEL